MKLPFFNGIKMLPEFLVCKFAKETLSLLVRERFGSEFPDIIQKDQVDYLYKYMSFLGCKTILMESDYVDRDYLEDYSRYYVKCFTQYGERCARLHFFTSEFTHSDFSKVLTEYDDTKGSTLNSNYLGFIVIKPLPKTFIGKTCLKVYPNLKSNSDKVVLSRKYRVSLFGIPLEVDTVAFQEQDKVVSACATTAIWTALQALDSKDLRQVPSCSEITLAAINYANESSNSFPNKGLNNKQILRALDVCGYRNHKINLDTKTQEGKSSFISIVQNYTRSKLPIILGTEVFDIDDGVVKKNDGHAVTVLGFYKNEAVYIHDDRVGPYAKATIYNIDSLVKSLKSCDADFEGAKWCIALRDKDESGNWVPQATQILVPDSIVVPNYKKVRVESDFIENTCRTLIEEYRAYYNEYGEKDIPEVRYTIKLESLAEIKKRVLVSPKIINKFDILKKCFAKYIWVAVFIDECGELLFELLFDSTDIPQGYCYSGCIQYNENYFDLVIKAPLNVHSTNTQLLESKHDFVASIAKSLKQSMSSYYQYLNNMFGEPRAPALIHDDEIEDNCLQEQLSYTYFGRESKSLQSEYPELFTEPEKYKIWVITYDGGLIIGDEIGKKGHPTLAHFKSARIAGELFYKGNKWIINAKSGRYSSNYSNANELLANAREKFLEIFANTLPNELEIQEYTPD